MNLRNWIIGGVAAAGLLTLAAPSAEARPYGYYGRPAARAYYGGSYYGGGYYNRGYYGPSYGPGYYAPGAYARPGVSVGVGPGVSIGVGAPSFYRW